MVWLEVNSTSQSKQHKGKLEGMPAVRGSPSQEATAKVSPVVGSQQKGEGPKPIEGESSPKGKGVNDNLHRELTHVSYSSPDDGASLMHFLGKRSLLAKIDLREAYRMVSIHPKDRRFLGISWQNSVYIDCQLPFSLASCLLYTSPSPRDRQKSRMPSSA